MRNAERRQFIVGFPHKRCRWTVQDFFHALGNIDDFQVVVEDENRVLGRRHDGVEERILAHRGRFVGNQEEKANGSVVFDEQIEGDVPPENLSVFLLQDNLVLTDFACLRWRVLLGIEHKALEFRIRDDFPERSAKQVSPVRTSGHPGDACTGPQDVELVVCQDERKVLAFEYRVEDCAGIHAVRQILEDYLPEKNAASHQRNDDQEKDAASRKQEKVLGLLAKARSRLALGNDVHKVHRKLRKRGNQDRIGLVVFRKSVFGNIGNLERIDTKKRTCRGQEGLGGIQRNFSQVRLVRKIGVYAVRFAVYEHRESPAFLGKRGKQVAKLVYVDVFGDDSLDFVAALPDRRGNCQDAFFGAVVVRRSRIGQSLVPARFEIPGLGAKFRVDGISLETARAGKGTLWRSVVDIDGLALADFRRKGGTDARIGLVLDVAAPAFKIFAIGRNPLRHGSRNLLQGFSGLLERRFEEKGAHVGGKGKKAEDHRDQSRNRIDPDDSGA